MQQPRLASGLLRKRTDGTDKPKLDTLSMSNLNEVCANGQSRISDLTPIRDLTPEEEARLNELSQGQEPVKRKFAWDDSFQRRLLAGLMTDPELYAGAAPVLLPEFFSNTAHVTAARILGDYWSRYKSIPSKPDLITLIGEALADKDIDVRLHQTAEIISAYDYHTPGIEKRSFFLERLRLFAKRQAVQMAFHKFMDEFNESPEKIDTVISGVVQGLQDVQRKTAQEGVDGLISFQDSLSMPSAKWLVRDHFSANTTGVIFGKYGSLKSFFAIELAVSVSSGKDFLGRYKVQQAPVLYIAGEGRDGYKNRLAASLKHHGFDKFKDAHLLFKRFDLSEQAEADRLLGLITLAGIAPRLVIIDTLSKNLAGSDSDPEKMGGFVRSMDYLRENLPGACVLAVHHTGKDETRGSRGHSSLPAGVETMIELKRTDRGCLVRQDKQKDADELPEYQLRAQLVDLGIDEEGLPLNSLVLVPEDGADTDLSVSDGSGVSERVQLEADMAAVVRLLPRHNDTPTKDNTLTRSQAGKELGWNRDKAAWVFKHIETEKAGPIRWTQFGKSENSPKLYWAEQPKRESEGECEC